MRTDKRFPPPDARPRASAILRTFVLTPEAFADLCLFANHVTGEVGRAADLDDALTGLLAGIADSVRAEIQAREEKGGDQ